MPMVNFEKIGANVGAAEAKVGSLTGGKGESIGLPKAPNAPTGDLDPETDPIPPEGSDVSQFWAEAEAMEAGEAQPAVLKPGENWAEDFSYVDTRASRNPILTPPPDNGPEDEDRVALTPDVGRREAQVLLGTIPGMFNFIF